MSEYIKTENGIFYKIIGKGKIRISREEYYNNIGNSKKNNNYSNISISNL